MTILGFHLIFQDFQKTITSLGDGVHLLKQIALIALAPAGQL